MSYQYNPNPGYPQQPQNWPAMQPTGQPQQYQNQGQQPSFLQASSSHYATTSNQHNQQQSQAYGQQVVPFGPQTISPGPAWQAPQPYTAGSASSAPWTTPQSSYASPPQTGAVTYPAVGFGGLASNGMQSQNTNNQCPARSTAAPLTSPPTSGMSTTSDMLYQSQLQPPAGGLPARDISAQDRQRYQTQNPRLLKAGLVTCPAGHAWFELTYRRVWICGCGMHGLSGKLVREIERTRDTADIELVNQAMPSNSAQMRRQGRREWMIAVHPPAMAPELPMHRVHRQYMEQVKQGGHYALRGAKGFAEDLPESKCRPCVCVRDLNIPVTTREIAPQAVSCSEFSSEGAVGIVDKDEDGADY